MTYEAFPKALKKKKKIEENFGVIKAKTGIARQRNEGNKLSHISLAFFQDFHVYPTAKNAW